jgi:hypothetical protein
MKLILVLIISTYLIITFAPDMPDNMIIIGVNEFLGISNISQLKYSSFSDNTSLVLIICGQIALLSSIVTRDKKQIGLFSILGIILLILALILTGIANTTAYGNNWWLTILTSLPFCGLTFFYLYNTNANKRHSK